MKKILILILAALSLFGAFFLFSREVSSACAFCSQKVIDTQLVFEGADVLALTTHKPAVDGHLLIIPKRHVEHFEDLSASEIAEMGEMVKKVDRAVKKVFKTTGSLLIQKNGKEAGQSVPHVHIHYLPTTKERSQVALAIRFFSSHWFKAKTSKQMAPEIALLQVQEQEQLN